MQDVSSRGTGPDGVQQGATLSAHSYNQANTGHNAIKVN